MARWSDGLAASCLHPTAASRYCPAAAARVLRAADDARVRDAANDGLFATDERTTAHGKYNVGERLATVLSDKRFPPLARGQAESCWMQMPRGGGNNKPVQLKPALPHQPNEMVVQQARVDTKKTGLSQHVTPVAANGKQAPVPKPASTNVAVALPALPSVTSFKIKSKDAAANSRWGKEPATAAGAVLLYHPAE